LSLCTRKKKNSHRRSSHHRFFPAQTTANDSKHAPSLQVIFSPSLIYLAGLFYLHAEHEQFTSFNN
jgi:hypothetical protein